MNEEVKRFFKSINFESNAFKEAKVDKVVLNKAKDNFEVILRNPNVISKDEIDNLLLCTNKGLNGKECLIKINYDEVNEADLKKYLDYYFKEIIKNKPSFLALKDYEMILDNKDIKIIINGYLETETLKKSFKKIEKELNKYYLEDYKISLIMKENNEKKSLNEELKQNREIKIKLNDSPLVFGFHKDGEITNLNNIYGEVKNIIIEAYIFDIEYLERKGQKATAYIVNMKISDETDSYMAKILRFNEDEYNDIVKKINLKADKASNLDNRHWFRFYGNIEMDQFLKCLVFVIKSMEIIPSKDEKVVDNAKEKRIELHAHTMMSMMDGVIEPKRLVKYALSLGHKAVAVTDHNVLQAFPDIFNEVEAFNKGKDDADKFKAIYGTELNIVDTEANLVYNEKNYAFKDQIFIVFDTETTGLNAFKDQMIEIGAVKVENGKVIDRFDELIACPSKLPKIITELTSITDAMLKDKDSEEEVTKRFLAFIEDYPLVAHNASFDISFVASACQKYQLKDFKNTVIDTMSLARTLYPNWTNHKLSTLVKNLEVKWDEEKHHRADYDCEGTSECFYKMVEALDKQNIECLKDLDKLIDKENIVKFARPFHLTILAKNSVGLKNLFRIISYANTKYLFKGKEPKLPRKDLIDNREGLLIGSGCINGEVFEKGFSLDDEELRNMMAFYDYIEVYPLNVVTHLIGKDQLFHNELEYYGYLKRLIKIAKDNNILVVATGDVHNLTKKDLIYRKIIINQKTNGKLHPLNHKGLEIPNQYFLTTDEMLSAFSFLDEDLRKEIVIDNPKKINEMISHLQIIKDKLYTPELPDSAEITKKMVYEKAHEIYGDPLPKIVEDRLEAELNGIIGGGFDVIYLIAEKLVKKSNADGYFVGSRGSVGSSLVATMMGITEVNGLPPHYICPKCKYSQFDLDGKPLNEIYPSGFDMPDLNCPKCKTKMNKNGHDIPFATFLGFKAEKVPDIDLNFSGDNQADAHNYVKELFGEDHAYRAGTISTVASKTAFGYVKGYCENNGIILNANETLRLAIGCTGVKRTTGQHPGGIIVIPQNMDVFDFTAYQYPADEPDSSWYTTHFDFHAIHDNVLKLDILGHDDPTMLKYLGDETKVNIMDIPFDDHKVLSLYQSPKALGVKEDDIMCQTGTLGIPEFGTTFAIRMLLEIKPKYFADLVKIAGLSHGTDVWNGNVRDIIVNNIAPFEEVVGCRDDIMVNLINYGLDSSAAFKISEFVRKGKAKKEPDKWAEHTSLMREYNVPEWFIDCCHKIQYMFPKAHACAYVMMSYRVAWFKLYYPLYYYSAFFSIRRSDFDIASMLKGYDSIKRKIVEIKEKGNMATIKEGDIADTLNVALEMLKRGYKFKNIDIEKSRAKTFVIDEDEKALYIPFMAVDGLGEAVAFKIEEERKIKPFYCVEDFAQRSKVNQTTIGKLKELGVFEGMPESAQMSLF